MPLNSVSPVGAQATHFGKVAYQGRGRVLVKATRETDITTTKMTFTESTNSSADPSVAEVPSRHRETLASRTNQNSENTDWVSLWVGTLGLPIANTTSTVCQDSATNVKTGVTLAAVPQLHPQGSEGKILSRSCPPEHADKTVHSRVGHRVARGSEGPCEFSVRELHDAFTGSAARKVQGIDLRSMRLEYVFSCLPGARHLPVEGFFDEVQLLAAEFACSPSLLVLYNRKSKAYNTKFCAGRLWHEVQMYCPGSQCQVGFFGGDIEEWEDYWRCQLGPGSQVLIRDSCSHTWSRRSVILAADDQVAVCSKSGAKVINRDASDLMFALLDGSDWPSQRVGRSCPRDLSE